jgi:membrane-bound ClpP family serine protease
LKSNLLKQYLGVALVVAGAILLIVSYVVGWTSSNLVLLSGLALIVLGVILHVKHIKSAEKY